MTQSLERSSEHAPASTQLPAYHRPLTPRQYGMRTTWVGLAVLSMPVLGILIASPLAWWLVLGTPLLALVWLRQRRFRRVQIAAAYEKATGLLNAGDVQSAADAFDEIAKDSRGTPAWHAIVVASRATTAMRLGDLERAQLLYRAALDSGWFHHPRGLPKGLRADVLAGQAICEALLGHHERAERVFEQMREITDGKPAVLVYVETVLASRRGDHATVVELLERADDRVETSMTAAQQRTLRLLHAFASESERGTAYRGEPLSARDQLAIEEARERRYLHIHTLAERWSELREFLARHGVEPPSGYDEA